MKFRLPTKMMLALVAAMSGVGSLNAADQVYEGKTSSHTIGTSTTWDGSETERVSYSNNTPKFYPYSGAVELESSMQEGGTLLNIGGYGMVNFDGNKVEAKGAAGVGVYVSFENDLHQGATLNIDENNKVSFCGNKGIATGTSYAYGGAIYVSKACHANIINNRELRFEDNILTANERGAQGGAIYSTSATNYASSLKISDNTELVSFARNSAESLAKYNVYGGAICASGANSSLELKGNASLSFDGNTAKTAGQVVQGGAIYAEGITDISGNGKLVYKNNSATSTYVPSSDTDAAQQCKTRGGAIYANHEDFSISGNTDVSFLGNSVRNDNISSKIKAQPSPFSSAGSGVVAGGAIFASKGLKIQGNDNVVFSGNYEKTSDGYRMRAICIDSTANDSVFSANAGGKIEFRDGITSRGGAQLNTAYGDQAQTGKIIMSGADAAENLLSLDENVSDEQIKASQSFEFEGAVTLHAGTLSLQDDAVLKATKLIIKEGATLEAVRTDDVAAVVFGISAEDAELLNPAATLDAALELEDGALVNLDGGNIDMGGNDLVLKGKLSVTLSGDMLGEDEIVLFSNVGNVENGEEIEVVVNGVTTTGNVIGNDVSVDIAGVPNIPEPTTATLSLLALAGLAARRRRK